MNQMNKMPEFDSILNTKQLGELIRATRKEKSLTLKKISELTRLSIRFLSELERGKETAEIGKCLFILSQLGLEIVIQPRGTQQQLKRMAVLYQRDNDE